MNYSKYSIKKRIEDLTYGDMRQENRQMYSVKTALVILAVLVFASAISITAGALVGIIKNAPDISAIEFSPVGYASKTYDSQGNQVATLVQAGSNREEVSFEEIPEDLINAFVAIEDQRFWEHDGIDFRSITRAVKGVFTGNSALGGGSTITQQLIKNNVFNGGNEKGFALYERKFQEWYIALCLENQPGIEKEDIKKQIITDYLNTINLGNNSLGVKVAAQRYFGKDVKDLDLAECTVLASITKNPSRYNPIRHPDYNQERREQVIDNMLDQGYITASQAKVAKSTKVYDEIKEVNESKTEVYNQVYSYFTDELISQVISALKEKLSLTEEQAKNMLYSGGLSIYTTQDPEIQNIVDEEVNNPDNYDTAKYSYKWRCSVSSSDGSTVNYSEKDVDSYIKNIKSGYNGLSKDTETIDAYIDEFKKTVIENEEDIIAETLDYTLEPQVSFVVIDQKTREVKAISGGRGEKEYSLTTNRATNTYRQPGSTFKVLTAFAPAIDEYGKTLGSVYYDSSCQVGEKVFRNWWSSGEYFGYSSIREGIEFSMNIVAVKCLTETVGTENGLEFAKKLGITTLTEEDNNAALALGGLTKGVSNLELTNAFASIADGGQYGEYKFFTKICDHEGNVIIDNTESEKKSVMREATAYLLTDAMRMSTVSHTKFADGYTVSNTSSRAHLDNMVCAGKSGTTTNNKDVWFVGFTPYYTAGIWAGCDENQTLYDSSTGEYNGGTSFHKDIWNKIMTRIHKDLEDPGSFEKPDNIVEVQICRKSGLLANEYCSLDERNGENAVYTEYFNASNVPTESCTLHGENGVLNISDEDLLSGNTDDTDVNAVRQVAETEEDTEALETEFTGPGSEAVIQGPGVYESSMDTGNVR